MRAPRASERKTGRCEMSEVRPLLEAIDRGELQRARERLHIVYEELRGLADARLACDPPGQALQATVLVHKVYLRQVADGNSPILIDMALIDRDEHRFDEARAERARAR